MAETTTRHTVRAFDEEMNALTGKIAEMGALAERRHRVRDLPLGERAHLGDLGREGVHLRVEGPDGVPGRRLSHRGLPSRSGR